MNIKHRKSIYAKGFINYKLSTINHKCGARRNDDAWGTMLEINPELNSEKGLVEGVDDLSINDNTFEITLDSENNTAALCPAPT